MTDINTIPDARMTASDFLEIWFFPYYGRLQGTRGDGGWCPWNRSVKKHYIQVDMGEVRSLCGVATQGAQRYSAWTTSYKLKLSTNGTTWSIYKETNIEKVWRELKLTFSAINKEFEVNANDRQTEIHLNGEYGHLSPLATAAENVVEDLSWCSATGLRNNSEMCLL